MTLVAPLPYSFDLSCPLPKSTKAINAPPWPYAVAGPSTVPQESADVFAKRRYLETLFLPDVLAPLKAFAQDIHRLPPSAVAGALEPLIISLPSIENRHRRMIPLLISTTSALADQASTDLTVEEMQVIRTGMALRLGSRVVADDGNIPVQKVIADQLEKRETLIQLILLLTYTQHPARPSSPAPIEGKSKKRKRARTSNLSPTSSPGMATDLLLDRISIWQALSGLDLDLDVDVVNPTGPSGNVSSTNAKAVKGKEKEENTIELTLRAFWDDVLVPFYLDSHPAILKSYHVKAFGVLAPATMFPSKPSSSAEVASSGGAKSRKPKLTRALGSADGQVYPSSATLSRSRSFSRAPSALLPPAPVQTSERGRSEHRERQPSGSRAPSRTGSEVSVGSERSFARTFSRSKSQKVNLSQSQGQSQNQFRRSRSVSIDPSLPPPPNPSASFSNAIAGTGKRPLARTTSSKGKELMNIQGRQVGLRRAGSKKLAPNGASTAVGVVTDSQGRENQSQLGQRGLMGRKTSSSSNPFRPKHFSSSTSSSSLSFAAQQESNTLIMATPSKPKSQSQQLSAWHPTPIQEEPSSSDRQGSARREFIAETPLVEGGRMRGEWAYGNLGDGLYEEEESGEGLGELMVMTDDEDMGDTAHHEIGAGKGKALFVPETPVK
ncbi:hypothetical protein IAR50_000057 [Cryptococcus sp. DSM 104548]